MYKKNGVAFFTPFCRYYIYGYSRLSDGRVGIIFFFRRFKTYGYYVANKFARSFRPTLFKLTFFDTLFGGRDRHFKVITCNYLACVCPYLHSYRILPLNLSDYKHLNVGTYHGTSEKTTIIGDNTSKRL